MRHAKIGFVRKTGLSNFTLEGRWCRTLIAFKICQCASNSNKGISTPLTSLREMLSPEARAYSISSVEEKAPKRTLLQRFLPPL